MPDPITWDELAKTIDDLTTIDEEIDIKVLTHNQDVSAHGQSNEGIYNHRIAEFLDHLDGSISLKKLMSDHILIHSVFESLDGWNDVAGGGTINCMIMGTNIRTDSATNAEGDLYIDSNDAGILLDAAKNPFFQTTVQMNSVVAVEAFIVAGDKYSGAQDDSFGFYIHDAALYAYWTRSGTKHEEAIAGITTTNINIYRAWCNASDSEIYFYVNGILKYTATTSFPLLTTSRFFTYNIKTTENVVKQMTILDFLFEQDR